MSSLSNLNRNILRMQGLNSGFDTESIIKGMLTTTQNKINNRFRSQAKMQWKQDLYKDINNELRKLKDDFSTVLKQEQNMLSEYNYRKFSIKMTNDNDAAYVSMTAEPFAKDGAVTIDYVSQLATADRAVSGSPDSSGRLTGQHGKGLKLTDTMLEVSAKLKAQGAIGTGFTFTKNSDGVEMLKFQLDGKEYEVSSYATLESVITSINANSANLKVSYSQLTDQFVVESRTTGYASTLSFEQSSFLSAFGIVTDKYPTTITSTQMIKPGTSGETAKTVKDLYDYFDTKTSNPLRKVMDDQDPPQFTGKYEFKLNGKDYVFDETMSITDMVAAVNEEERTNNNFNLSYSETTGQFTVISKHNSARLEFEDGGFLAATGINEPRGNIYQGQDAILSIDGHLISRDSNDFQIDGVNYSLKKTFNENQSQDGKNITFTLSRDVQSSVDMVKKYVEAYNTLIERLNDILTQKVDRDYYPLTDEEKGEMTEKQIEKWEESAKKGLLRNDGQLQGLVSSLRMSFFNKVPGQNLMAADIGLGGGGTAVTSTQLAEAKTGKIFIDETKLREALTNNPDQVFAMFTAKSESGNTNEMGLVTRVNALIDQYVKNNEYVTQYYNDQEITRAKSQYTEMMNKMYQEEERLWARFTAMETALSKLNSQSSWIGSMMGGSGG